jgi:hypothetical protein
MPNRPINDNEYKLLKIFPKNGRYLKRNKIEKYSNRLLSERSFNSAIDFLYDVQSLNGDINGVGLRITEEGKDAVAEYKINNQWSKRHPTLDKFKTGAITALFSLAVGILLYLLTTRKESLRENQQDRRLDSLTNILTNIQKHIKDSAIIPP